MSPHTQDFNYDPDAGVKYPCKVIKAREMTVGEFDTLRDATLGQKLPADQTIFYLELENLEALTPGTTRSTFFMPDNAPVSKWAKFKKALKLIEVTIKRNPDGTTDLEGKYFVAEELEVSSGKYGISNTTHLVDLLSPEDIDRLEGARRALYENVSNVGTRQDIIDAILGIAQGMKMQELEVQLASLGFKGYAAEIMAMQKNGILRTTPEGNIDVLIVASKDLPF